MKSPTRMYLALWMAGLLLQPLGIMPTRAETAAPEKEAVQEIQTEDASMENLVAEEAAPKAKAMETVTNQAATGEAAPAAASAGSSDDELIQLEAERKLSSGIDVVSEEAGEDLITLTLDDVPLQDVIRMFTRISGANIVAGTNLQGRVTVSLKDVEWKPALDVILDSVNMALIEKADGIYTVMSKKDLANEPVVTDTVFLKYTTVSNVLPVVQHMLVSTNASATGVAGANGLVIQETVQRLAAIKDTVKEIDRPRPQVFIEAKFIELNDSAIKDLGIDWEVLRGYTVRAANLTRDYSETRRKVKVDTAGSTTAGTQSRSDNSFRELFPAVGSSGRSRTINDSVSSIDQQFSFAGRNYTSVDEGKVEMVIPFESTTVQSAILSADEFSLTLSALQENDGVSIVSNPKVIVANGETASIHVGKNQPNIVAVPTGDSGDRFAYTLDSDEPFIEIGVKVNVTPTVNTENNITVKIVPELSRLLGFETVGVADIRFPITEIKQVVTEFNLQSGQTVAIGGLTETSNNNTVKKIPVLGSIPLIGKYLFSHSHTEKVQTEVVIFVTVGMANPDTLVEVSGIPSKGRLIHEHLAREHMKAAQTSE